jgi:hypothetical protein
MTQRINKKKKKKKKKNVDKLKKYEDLFILISLIVFILFQDAALVCKDYMARDPDNLLFTVVALAANN